MLGSCNGCLVDLYHQEYGNAFVESFAKHWYKPRTSAGVKVSNKK